MKKVFFVVVILTAIGLFQVVAMAGAAGREALDKEVRLYKSPGPKDSYTLFYDIKVKSPGVIRVGVQVNQVSPEKDIPRRLVGIGLVPNGNKKTVRQAICGKDGGKFEYSIDALELEKTNGEYRIIVSNFSCKHTVSARLVARYPGEEAGTEEMPVKPRKPDLAVGDIRLNDRGLITVEVLNTGTAPLPSSVWTERNPKSVSVFLEINGKNWGGSTIWAIDPGRSLQKPGSSIVYTSNYKATGPVKVRAVVDKTRQLDEQDESNNTKAVMLRP